MSGCLGLDVGGANIKLAVVDDLGRIVKSESIPFALWKHKEQLADQLRSLIDSTLRHVDVAVTMTGELADCFESRQAGVKFIVESLSSSCQQRKLALYGIDGNWYDANEAIRKWETIAAANWHSIASFASRFLPDECGFLIDVGSTTTDIIPVCNGAPTTDGKNDFGRLRASELLYAGASRTPVSSIMPSFTIENQNVGAARELFATMNDVFLMTTDIKDSPVSFDTADGRPATKYFASKRLARMVCEDADQFGAANVFQIAAQTKAKWIELFGHALRTVLANNPGIPKNFVLSGQGDWLGRQALQQVLSDGHLSANVVQLNTLIGEQESCGAAAVAVATLSFESNRDDQPMVLGSRSDTTKQELPLRIVKLGGSLLNWPETPTRIASWFAEQPPARNIWLVGGGKHVDLIRQWDASTPIDETDAHWICVELMSITARLVRSWFPAWPIVKSVRELHCVDEINVVFDPSDWLRTKSEVPTGWSFTSDSCAALLAGELGATELILLKSRDVCDGMSRELWSQDGMVDPDFCQWSKTIEQVQIVNLRGEL